MRGGGWQRGLVSSAMDQGVVACICYFSLAHPSFKQFGVQVLFATVVKNDQTTTNTTKILN